MALKGLSTAEAEFSLRGMHGEYLPDAEALCLRFVTVQRRRGRAARQRSRGACTRLHTGRTLSACQQLIWQCAAELLVLSCTLHAWQEHMQTVTTCDSKRLMRSPEELLVTMLCLNL